MTIMTNEERAREAAKKVVDFPLLEAVESIILTALNAATAELEAEKRLADAATAYAEGLAIILAQKHFPEVPEWKPLTGDLIGLLTQIDNMTSGLTRSALAKKEPSNEPVWFLARRNRRLGSLRDADEHHSRRHARRGLLMTTPLDLEELKRLVAEREQMLNDPLFNTQGVGVLMQIESKLSNALPELIARVERAEKALKAATERVEEIIERADTKAEDAGSDTEERAYYEGRMEAAIAISNTLTGDTPNV